jgi:hypothetical protein
MLFVFIVLYLAPLGGPEWGSTDGALWLSHTLADVRTSRGIVDAK